MDNEYILQDRLQKIRQVINKYGIENFCIAFSGGLDSCVLSELVDIAIPDNNITRVYTDTGIELNMIRDFVYNYKKHKVEIIKPSKNIQVMLKDKGYPFKSKQHSMYVARYQKSGRIKSVEQYLGERQDKKPWSSFSSCPKILRYQFENTFNLKISDKCCDELKEKPFREWQKINNNPYSMVGVMRAEGGRRVSANCLAFKNNKLEKFQPLVPLTKEWEWWFIEKYNVEICDIYKSPYNFERTGCKGCPFARYLENELEVLEKYFPNERKQCETIWKPVYDEYRRIGYRLSNGK